MREVEARTHILKRLGGCFEDHRRADRVEHPVERLVKQRVLGICLGYEDLNDHDELCRDRLLALLCECGDIDGAGRRQEADRGKPLAGKSTLNRLELMPAAGPEARYKKTAAAGCSRAGWRASCPRFCRRASSSRRASRSPSRRLRRRSARRGRIGNGDRSPR